HGAPRNLGTPNVEDEVERTPLVVANRLVVQLADQVSRHVVETAPYHLVVDRSLPARRAKRTVEIAHRESTGRNRWQVDELARPRERTEQRRLRLEVPLDESLPLDPGDALHGQLPPSIDARVIRRSRVVRVRLDLPEDVI